MKSSRVFQMRRNADRGRNANDAEDFAGGILSETVSIARRRHFG
jgi:hypothetical protein